MKFFTKPVFLRTALSAFLLCAVLSQYCVAQTTIGASPYFIPSSGTYTVPAGVASIKVECWGGGGGGGGANGITTNFSAAGGGGGGAYSLETLTVAAGQIYTATIGTQGTSGAASGGNGGTGGTTTLTGTGGTCSAAGGSGGKGNSSGSAANGGAGGAAGTGYLYAGGAGAKGNFGTGLYGGGGGGGAGDGSVGTTATTNAGGAGGTGTYTGGTGGTSQTQTPNAAGRPGNLPGGGGSGGFGSVSGGSGGAGGAGALGQIVLTYILCTSPAPTITSFLPTSACAGSGTTITINGSNFISGGTIVTINGVNATPVTFIDTTQVTVALPAGATGTGNIVVTACLSATSASTFTVDSAPAITVNPATAAQNVCLNATATALTVAANGTGTLTYQWYQNAANNNTSGTLISGANTNSYTPLTTTAGALYYYCVVSGTCTPAASSATSGLVTVSGSSGAPNLYNVTGGGTYCSGGGGVPIELSGSQSGINYQLQLNGSNTGSPVAGPGSPFSFPDQTAAGTYTVIASGGCSAATEMTDSAIVTIISAAPATPGAITGPGVACSGDIGKYSIAPVSGATSYTWTLPGGWSGSSSVDSINTLAASGGGNISVTANNSCGASTAQTFTVNTGPAPATPGTISGPGSACGGDADTFSVATVSGATSYTWTLPFGWTGTSATDSISAMTASGGGTISVTANNACGSSVAQTLNVAAGATPAMPGTISGPTTACGGDADTFSIAPVSGASSYSWVLPGGWAGSSATTNINTVAASGGGTISVTANNGCGGSTAQTLNISSGATPATPGTISGPASACNGDADTFSIAAVSGATSYTWTLPGGWTGSSATTSINTIAAGGGGTVSVTANNACGSSTAQTLNIAGGVTPATPGSITGPSIVCTGSALSYSVATVSGATSCTWALPGGWTGTSTTESINTTVAGAGTISVIANNACGSSTAQTLAVTLGSIPATPGAISGPDSICDGSSGAYSVDTVAGANAYTWTLPTGWTGTSTTNSINATGGTGSGSITVTAGNGCGQSAAQTLSVTLNPVPTVSYTFTGSPVCNNINPTVTLTGGTPAGGVYSGQGVSGTTFDASSLTAGNYVITYSYTTALGCTGSDTSTAIVTVCSGIENLGAQQIAVYPNPFNDAVIINMNGSYGNGTAVLMDATGREISSLQFAAGAMSVQLNTGALANGAYLLEVLIDGKQIAVRKMFRME